MRILRLMTALGVLLFSAVSVVWGVQALQFGAAHAHIIASESDGEEALPWARVPGLTTDAFEVALLYPTGHSEARRLVAATQLVTVEPTSSSAWLSLAESRFALGFNPSTVKQALVMSWVTGQNEGDIMWSRGVFAASLWNQLSAHEQHEAVSDLTGVLLVRAIGDDQIRFAKAVWTHLPTETRGKVADALKAAGSTQAQILALGLTSP